MEDEKELRQMIEEDLQYCEEMWSSYSHDKEKLGEIFQRLLVHYEGKIDGFHEDLAVIQNREPSADSAEVYRRNILLLLERIKGFLDNGCSNEGLAEYYIRKEQKPVDMGAGFTAVRISLGMRHMPALEKEEIMEKLDEMEEICAKAVPRGKKWELIRGYLIWLSGKDVETAMEILPLFFKINNMMIQGKEHD